MHPGQQRKRLHTRDAAEYLGISPRTLEKARLTGRGPAFLKVFNRVVYDIEDLDAFAAARRRHSTSGGSAT